MVQGNKASVEKKCGVVCRVGWWVGAGTDTNIKNERNDRTYIKKKKEKKKN